MNKKNKLALILATLALTANAALAVDPTSFDPSAAVSAATSNMWAVIGGCMVLVGVGASIRYGIKAWKAIRAAV